MGSQERRYLGIAVSGNHNCTPNPTTNAPFPPLSGPVFVPDHDTHTSGQTFNDFLHFSLELLTQNEPRRTAKLWDGPLMLLQVCENLHENQKAWFSWGKQSWEGRLKTMPNCRINKGYSVHGSRMQKYHADTE